MPVKAKKSKKPKLKRSLSLFHVTMYGIGIILGAGIYALIGEAAGLAGNALWISFVLGAVIASFTGLSYAELGSMYPKEAAEFVYTKKAFKRQQLSFLLGWLIIFIGVVAAATVSLGFGNYLSSMTGVNPILAGGGLIVALSLLNFWGIEQSARANILFTLVELSGLLIIIFLGFTYGNMGSTDLFFSPTGFSGIFAGAILIFFAYIGFEDVVNVAEETKDPRRAIPLALFISIAVTTIIYILVSIASVSLLPWETLAASAAPLADVAESAVPGFSSLLSIIALFATANTVLIIMIVQSRMVYGMARERSLPKFLGRIHHVRRTPWISIFLIMFVALAFISIGNIRTIAEVTNFGVFVTFILVNSALIVLRYRQPRTRRPFRVPLNIGKFPILPAIAIIFALCMLLSLDLHVVGIGAGILVAGFIFYHACRFKKLVK